MQGVLSTEVDKYADQFKKREIFVNNVKVQHVNELNLWYFV